MSTVYILGAGASKAVIDTAPLNHELLPSALGLTDSPTVQNIKSHIEEFYINSDPLPPLEDVLTQIDICIAENRPIGNAYSLERLRSLREDLIYAICRVLEFALRTGSTELMRRFIRRLHEDDTVISLNYDLIIDNSMINQGKSPFYGFPVRHYWDYFPENGEWIDETGLFARSANHPDSRELLKLHGSLNWLYCPACRMIDVTPGLKGAVYIFQKDTLRRETPITCRECGVRYDPYIVTPTFLKNYGDLYLSEIWQRAENQLSHASEIVFIGYSLPDADVIFRTMISRALYRSRYLRRQPDGRLASPPPIAVVDYVRDYDEDDTIKDATRQRYKKLFGNIDYLPHGFEMFVRERMA